jgi:hypothetical protein
MGGTVQLTSGCINPPDEKRILFPRELKDAELPSQSRVLVWNKEKERILRFSSRSDDGSSACVDPSVLATFGTKGVTVEFQGISLWGRFLRDRMLFLQLTIALLTLAGAVFSIIGTYVKSTGDKATPFEQETAVVVLVIAAVLAWLKLIKEVLEA